MSQRYGSTRFLTLRVITEATDIHAAYIFSFHPETEDYQIRECTQLSIRSHNFITKGHNTQHPCLTERHTEWHLDMTNILRLLIW
jgi:hypothetical protein